MKRVRMLAIVLAVIMSLSPIGAYAGTIPEEKGETVAIAERFLLNHQEISIDLDNSYPLPLYLTTGYYTEPSNTKKIIWKSGNESVARVDDEGRIIAVAPGEATITATHSDYMGKSAECKVKVYQNMKCNTFYYVSPDGSDSYQGTESQPFKTIEQARDTIRGLNTLPDGGITVVLEDGKYYEQETIILTPEDSGTEDKPIVYKARNEGKAFITGEVPVTNWKKADSVEGMDEAAVGKVYVADVDEGWRFHDLYVNGERQQVSRSFNTDKWREWPIFYGRAPLSYDSEKGAKVVFGEGELDGLEGNDDVEVILLPVMYWNSIPLVKHIDAKNRTAYLQSQIPSNFWKDHFGTNEGYYNIINTLKYLDQPGEWCIDSQAGKVYYWPQNEDSINKDEIVAPKPYELLRLQGDGVEENFENLVEYVTFDGIVFQYTDRLPENEFPEDWIIRNAENPDAAVYFDGTRHCRLVNSEIRHSGSYGVTVNHYGQNNEILHNQMHDLGSGGVQLYGYGVGTVDVNHNNIVMYNTIYNMGVAPYQHAPGLGVFGSGCNTMAFNYIAGAPYAGISIVGTDENSISATNPDTRAAYDLFGKQSSQYGIRFQELDKLPESERDGNKGKGEYFSIGTLAEKYQHSERNVAEYNILEDYSQSMDDGGALYSWYSGLGNVYANNVLKEELTGSRTWIFWRYMDDRALGFTLQNNFCSGNFNATIDKSFNPYKNRDVNNLYAKFPAVPEGYDTQKQKIFDTVDTQVGGFKLGESKKPEIIWPTAESEDVKIPTTIAYNQCENASLYKVEIATDSEFENIIDTMETKASVVTTDKLEYETQYYVRVTTREFLNVPQISDVVAFKTAKQEAPDEVLRETELFNDIDAVLVQWKPVEKNQVNVYRKAEDEVEYKLIGENIEGKGYLDSQIQQNTTYSYQVAGVNKAGEGPRSKEMIITTRELNVLFSDNFDGGIISDQWTDIEGNRVNLNAGNAKVVNGQWEPAGSWKEYYVGLNDKTWGDYAVEADITFKSLQAGAESYSAFGLITRASGTNAGSKNFYQFLIRTNTEKKMELQKCIGGRYWTTLATIGMDEKPKDGSLYRMRAESVGSSLRIYLNGILYAEVQDNSLVYGGVGIGYGKDNISVDNVRVSQPKQYQIKSDEEMENGIVTADRTQAAQGVLVELTVTPDAGYELTEGSLKVNGEAVKGTDYRFTMPKEDVVITAEFKPVEETKHTIEVIAGEGGRITPNGTIAVVSGSSITFEITANEGYTIEDVLVDEVSVGKVSEYTFDSVAKSYKIEAKFVQLPEVDYRITATAGEGGRITPNGTMAVVSGSSITFEITANEGYSIEDVFVDKVSVGNFPTYTFDKIVASHTISATFKKIVEEVMVTGIEVSSSPKTSYVEGQDLDLRGGKLKVYYSDGSDKEIDMTSVMVSGYEKYRIGTQNLVITYEGKTTILTVSVREAYRPEPTPTPTPEPTPSPDPTPAPELPMDNVTVEDGKAIIIVDVEKEETSVVLPTDIIVEQLNNVNISRVSVNVQLSENDKELSSLILEKLVIDEVRKNNKDIEITVMDKEGKLLYSWNLGAKDMNNSKNKSGDVHLALSMEKASKATTTKNIITKDKDNSEGIALHMEHNGVLPSQAKVKIYVGDQKGIKPGKKAYLYAINTKKQKYETVPYGTPKVDEDGYITINILQGGEYVILANRPSLKETTSLRQQIKVTPKVTINVKESTTINVSLPVTMEVVANLSDMASSSAKGKIVISYKSSNRAVATVSKNGKVTAKKAGTVTITTTIKLYTGTTKVCKTKIVVK